MNDQIHDLSALAADARSEQLTQPTRAWLVAARRATLVLVVGFLAGVLTSRGQTFLPDPFNQYANSYSVWLAVSFVVGALLPHRWWAAGGGVVVQYLALVGYYIASWVFLGAPAGSIGFILFWALGGTVGGPLLALGGFWWRTRRDIYAIAGSAMLGAIFISEGAYILTVLRYAVGASFIAVGIIATFLTSRHHRDIRSTVGLLALFSTIMYLGFTFGFGFLATIAARF